jgi:hypothetical protein
MSDDASQTTGIYAKPTYQASLRLGSGATVRVTVLNGEILTDIRDDDGYAVSARMTGREAMEVASMHNAADRQCD